MYYLFTFQFYCVHKHCNWCGCICISVPFPINGLNNNRTLPKRLSYMIIGRWNGVCHAFKACNNVCIYDVKWSMSCMSCPALFFIIILSCIIAALIFFSFSLVQCSLKHVWKYASMVQWSFSSILTSLSFAHEPPFELEILVSSLWETITTS